MASKETFVLFALILASSAVPKHGNNHGLLKDINGHILVKDNNGTCASLAMVSKSSICVSLSGVHFSKKDQEVDVSIVTELYESQCERVNEQDCDDIDFISRARLVATNHQILKITSDSVPVYFKMSSTSYVAASKLKRDTNKQDDAKISTTPITNSPQATNDEEGSGATTTPATPTPAPATPTPVIIYNNINQTTKPNWRTFTTNSSGIFIVFIRVTNNEKVDNYSLAFDIEMRNRFGFISLVDYPALVTYGLLLVLYIFYSFLWLLMMAFYYKDIIRLQFWILAVILMGFIEKIFFVAEYGSANEGHNSSGLIYIAEGVSAGKRALARVLLIVVCEGFGTVKPRLGPILTKVLVVGGIYFVAAFIEGISRASQMNTDGFDLTKLVTQVVVLFINMGVAYWIFSALVNTRRALRVRKNAVKLALYNHLAYTLIATVIASLAFTVWELVTLVKGTCTSDWHEIWLTDSFWHVLFSFVLLVIMIIWRPSANKLRFAYTQVNLDSDEEDEEQGANKNYENVKMRNVGGPKPVSMSQEAEDDLKWAEENLPTTLIDKTLPVVLDSEEEVMTTRFEASKMN